VHIVATMVNSLCC